MCLCALQELLYDQPVSFVRPRIIRGVAAAPSPEEMHNYSEDAAERCDLVIAVGYSLGSRLTVDMQRERAARPGPCINLMRYSKDLFQSAHGNIHEIIQRGLTDLEQARASAASCPSAMYEEDAVDELSRQEALPPFCDGCGSVIEPEVCCCGDVAESYEHHAHLGGNHAFVPAGCRCGFVDTDGGAVAKGLRERLRAERRRAGPLLDF